MSRRDLKVVHVSDSHTYPFGDLIPECDVLLHSGDGTFSGSLTQIRDVFEELKRVAKVAKHVIYVPGNHDRGFEDKPSSVMKLREEMEVPENVHIITNGDVEIEGYTFFGISYTPEFCNWALNLERNGEKTKHYWDVASKHADVIISHGPPYGIMDYVPHDRVNVGCNIFKKTLPEFTQLKLCCFGHIHEGYACEKKGNVIFANGSLVNGNYDFEALNKIRIFTLSDTGAEILP
jgi:Icc-related predicted phosphoesterase